MFDTKSLLASRTIWVNLITLVAGTALGAKYLAGVDPGPVADAISQFVIVIGPIVSSIFRAIATKKIVSPTPAS